MLYLHGCRLARQFQIDDEPIAVGLVGLDCEALGLHCRADIKHDTQASVLACAEAHLPDDALPGG